MPSLFRRLLLTLFASAVALTAFAADRPNVVLIILDDMNGFASRDRDIYPPMRMPHLDAFRAESVNFINAVCSVPVCNPSRAGFLSGLNAHQNGAYLNGADVWNKPGSVNSRLQSLPAYFTAHGYTTWAAGKVFHSKLNPGQEEAIFVNGPYPQGGFGPFPHEFTNLANRPESRPILERLRREVPTAWAPSWGGRWEVRRPDEPERYGPDPAILLPEGYDAKSET